MNHGAHGAGKSQPDQPERVPEESHGGLKHWGLMLLCCLPMIAIFLLIVLGIWSW